MRAPISVCIIHRDSILLEACLRSIRDHVTEIIVVDTGSQDENFKLVKCCLDEGLIDKLISDTSCNNAEGLIEDFSVARTVAFNSATQPWVMWIDSDDVLTGGEFLNLLCKDAEEQFPNQNICFMFPYEYGYDEFGNCVSFQDRERLVFNKNAFKWIKPVHEILVPIGAAVHLKNEDVVFKHRRHLDTTPRESGRNLRILRSRVISDARDLYYLGVECHENNLDDDAIEHLTKFTATNGCEEECVIACLRISFIYESRKQYADAIQWAFTAIDTKETWGEGYFALARINYTRAIENNSEKKLRFFERCVNYAKLGLSLPPTRSLVFNPRDRELYVHQYLSVALAALNDVEGARSSALEALKFFPDDENLKYNLSCYDAFIAAERENRNVRSERTA